MMKSKHILSVFISCITISLSYSQEAKTQKQIDAEKVAQGLGYYHYEYDIFNQRREVFWYYIENDPYINSNDPDIEKRVLAKEGMKNPAIEKEIRTLVKENYDKRKDLFYKSATIKRIIIENKDWNPVKDSYGVIKSKILDFQLVLEYKGKFYVHSLEIERKYLGAGKYSTDSFLNEMESTVRLIKPEKVK